MLPRLDFSAPLRLAIAGAGVAVAQQVASKALRDALFLAHHPVTSLPLALVLSAIASIALVLSISRLSARVAPARLLSTLTLAHAALLAIEWAALGSAPRAASFVIFMQVSAFGTALLSGFWLQVSEAFDPRSARRALGAIGAGGALGGLGGGAAAQLASMRGGFGGVLVVVLAALVLSAFVSARLRGGATEVRADERESNPLYALAVLRHHRYLTWIGLLLALVSVAAVLLDYLFKLRVVASFDATARVGVFSAFYATTSLLTCVVQLAIAGPLLARSGFVPAIAALPVGLAAAGATLLALPGFAAGVLARGIEAVLRSSTFRTGYEQLFTPLAAVERRATKTLLDVGFDRAGDAAGAALIGIVLLFAGGAAPIVLAVLVVLLAAEALAIVPRLRRGYVEALERGLARGMVDVDPADVADRTTRDTIALSLASFRVDRSALGLGPREGASEQAAAGDDSLQIAVRSNERMRIRLALANEAPWSDGQRTAAIRLLARDEFASDALRALRNRAAKDGAAFAAALRDRSTPDAARRRLARVMLEAPAPIACEALFDGLRDERFDVRFACGRALARLHTRHPEFAIAPQRVFEAVCREAKRTTSLPEAARLVDDAPDETEALLGAAVKDRAHRVLEHCFTLLLAVTEADPIRVAWQALQTNDPALRGTALEYLEHALPEDVRAALWPHLEDTRPRRGARPADAALADLLAAHPSIEIRLSELRERRPER